jgi:hypothetical protein
MKTEAFWSGVDGDAYTARNRVDWRKRIKFWREITETTAARSVFELGANSGWNLSAIQAATYKVYPVETYGYDLNETAATQCAMAGHTLTHYPPPVKSVDLAFTVGVLIHVSDDHLARTMQTVVDTSADYVLAVEYGGDARREINYRGQDGLCWARDYGTLYQAMGLKPVSTGGAGDGFDDCTFWLLRR